MSRIRTLRATLVGNRWSAIFNREAMCKRGEVLVAIVNDKRDFAIIRNQKWYRIPVSSVKKWLNKQWPPKWIAFYQTKVFGNEAYTISYYAQVLEFRTVRRSQLFPNDPPDKKSNYRYYQLILNQIKKLPQPIISRRRRRIIFIPTTWQKFFNAIEINDLYDDSPLEDRLWEEFKRHDIPVERQEFITVENQNYVLDFAIYCAKGNIAVEADGDTWHANPEKSIQDNLRDNELKAVGWNVFHFTTHQIKDQAETYCVPKVTKALNNLGGIDDGRYVPRKIDMKADGSYQLGFFDDFEAE